MIKLYHGSTVNIESIDLTKSRPNKDFGQGFYLSISLVQNVQYQNYRRYDRLPGYRARI